MNELRQRINQIFISVFELDPELLTPDAQLYSDLGLDSIDAIDLVVSFEREFKMRPANEEIRAIRTLGDVYALVDRYHQAAHHP